MEEVKDRRGQGGEMNKKCKRHKWCTNYPVKLGFRYCVVCKKEEKLKTAEVKEGK